MKIATFVPYGLQNKEAGLITIVSNYLKQYEMSVEQLRCNGIVPSCDRDGAEGWQRSITSCLKCISEQSKLGAWSEQSMQDLSPYLLPEDVDQTKRWMLSLDRDSLLEASYEGVELAKICKASFEKRFDTERPDVMNRANEMAIRRMLLASLRVYKTFSRYILKKRPDCALVASGEDYITSAAALAFRENKVKVSLFSWNKHSNDIAIEHPITGKVATYPLVFDNVTQLRKDIRSWPTELSRMLEEIIAFIDLAPAQVALPLAR